MIWVVEKMRRYIARINRQRDTNTESNKRDAQEGEAAAIDRIAAAIERARDEDKPVEKDRFFLEKAGILFLFLTTVATGYTAWVFYQTM
jgi:hypothetical protein